jgi:hypothetical protein
VTNPDTAGEPPDIAEVARVLWQLAKQIDSGAVTATPAMRYRLEGAAMALAALGEGRRLDIDELLSALDNA